MNYIITYNGWLYLSFAIWGCGIACDSYEFFCAVVLYYYIIGILLALLLHLIDFIWYICGLIKKWYFVGLEYVKKKYFVGLEYVKKIDVWVSANCIAGIDYVIDTKNLLNHLLECAMIRGSKVFWSELDLYRGHLCQLTFILLLVIYYTCIYYTVTMNPIGGWGTGHGIVSTFGGSSGGGMPPGPPGGPGGGSDIIRLLLQQRDVRPRDDTLSIPSNYSNFKVFAETYNSSSPDFKAHTASAPLAQRGPLPQFPPLTRYYTGHIHGMAYFRISYHNTVPLDLIAGWNNNSKFYIAFLSDRPQAEVRAALQGFADAHHFNPRLTTVSVNNKTCLAMPVGYNCQPYVFYGPNSYTGFNAVNMVLPSHWTTHGRPINNNFIFYRTDQARSDWVQFPMG